MNIKKALEFAATQLRTAEIPEPEREASSLLRLVIKRDKTFLYSNPDHQLDAVESILFKAVVKRRVNHEPFQYISGKEEFCGREYEVTPAVLIPRPETEMLVEAAIERLKTLDAPRFLDLGVGSGCISVTILADIPNSSAVGVDISEKALEVASRNAEIHDVANRIELNRSDLFENVAEETFDAVLSNPPYIPSSDIETLQPEVRDKEPRTALDGGADGLDIVRSIVDESIKYLRSGSPLILEIGIGQSGSVAALFDTTIWRSVEVLKDFQSIDRIVIATKK